MHNRWIIRSAIILIISIILFSFLPSHEAVQVNAATRTLSWSIVDTPSNNLSGGLIVSPSEINAFAIAPDNKTLYAADTANNAFYKSSDAGITWFSEIGNRLSSTPGASMPVWDLAVAPDDSKFILAVTGIAGPIQIFVSIDGGGNWTNTGFSAPGEYISCLDISKNYGTSGMAYDIAVGTRMNPTLGNVYTIQYSTASMGSWSLPSSITYITSVKFSPNYSVDHTIIALSVTATTTLMNLGLHDTSLNDTNWNDASYGTSYPVQLTTDNLSTLIKSDLELPSDFDASISSQRGCFASIQVDAPTPAAPPSVYYVNTELANPVINITPPMSSPYYNRITSIAYTGTEATGILLAGETFTDNTTGLVNVWQSSTRSLLQLAQQPG